MKTSRNRSRRRSSGSSVNDWLMLVPLGPGTSSTLTRRSARPIPRRPVEPSRHHRRSRGARHQRGAGMVRRTRAGPRRSVFRAGEQNRSPHRIQPSDLSPGLRRCAPGPGEILQVFCVVPHRPRFFNRGRMSVGSSEAESCTAACPSPSRTDLKAPVSWHHSSSGGPTPAAWLTARAQVVTGQA